VNKLVRTYFLLLIAIAAVGIVVAMFTPVGTSALDADEIAPLASRARVTWADYGEEIKAELGATPAALWHGAPVGARLADGGIEVRFALSGPWAEFNFGMPILLRDPEGNVSSPARYTPSAPGGVYFFNHAGAVTPLSVPWVEVKFPPNDERRIVFDSAGNWSAPAR